MIFGQLDDNNDIYNLACSGPPRFHFIGLSVFASRHGISSSLAQGNGLTELSLIFNDYYPRHFIMNLMKWLSHFLHLRILHIKFCNMWDPHRPASRNYEILVAELVEERLPDIEELYLNNVGGGFEWWNSFKETPGSWSPWTISGWEEEDAVMSWSSE